MLETDVSGLKLSKDVCSTVSESNTQSSVGISRQHCRVWLNPATASLFHLSRPANENNSRRSNTPENITILFPFCQERLMVTRQLITVVGLPRRRPWGDNITVLVRCRGQLDEYKTAAGDKNSTISRLEQPNERHIRAVNVRCQLFLTWLASVRGALCRMWSCTTHATFG